MEYGILDQLCESRLVESIHSSLSLGAYPLLCTLTYLRRISPWYAKCVYVGRHDEEVVVLVSFYNNKQEDGIKGNKKRRSSCFVAQIVFQNFQRKNAQII